MFQSNTNTLSLTSFATNMPRTHYSNKKEEKMTLVLLQGGFNEQRFLYLNHLIKDKDSLSQEKTDLVCKVKYITKVSQWITYESTTPGGLEKALSPHCQLQIVELMGFALSLAKDAPKHTDQIYSASQKILTRLFEVVEQSERPELRRKYINCISKMFQVNSIIINLNIYAKMLSVSENNVDQFYQFLDYYLPQRNQYDEAIIGFILEGFAKRMKMFSETTIILPIECPGILQAYDKLIAFLRLNLDTTFPELVLTKYSCIYESLLSFVNREFDQENLCKVFNHLVEVYMQSSVDNSLKFSFVLDLYKKFLSKASSLFKLISTKPITRDHDFLSWFVEWELRQENSQEVLQTYFKDQHSLQFMLVIAIVCCGVLPQRIEHVSRFTQSIKLSSESSDFLTSREVQGFLQAYYTLTRDVDSLDELFTTIEQIQH